MSPHIVNHITEFECVRLILNLEFVGFSHGISRISLSVPLKRRQTRNLAITLQLSVSNKILSLYNIFYVNVKSN